MDGYGSDTSYLRMFTCRRSQNIVTQSKQAIVESMPLPAGLEDASNRCETVILFDGGSLERANLTRCRNRWFRPPGHHFWGGPNLSKSRQVTSAKPSFNTISSQKTKWQFLGADKFPGSSISFKVASSQPTSRNTYLSTAYPLLMIYTP
jgi:hypothetical protein